MKNFEEPASVEATTELSVPAAPTLLGRIRDARALAGLGLIAGAIALFTPAEASHNWFSDGEARPATGDTATQPGRFAETLDVQVFQKGNLHTHTRRSDGDSPAELVYAWYREHGYNFVALTDHNQRTWPDGVESMEGPGFAIIPGEELTMTVGPRNTPVHVNALCHETRIGGKHFDDAVSALSWGEERVRETGGIALINHPNFEWALSASDLLQSGGAPLLEIASGHPSVRTEGDENHPSAEALWDTLLTAGRDVSAVAVDDMHRLGEVTNTPNAPPGKGWVQVFAREASAAAICDGLARGHLYASTGAELSRVRVTDDVYSVWPSAAATTVEFFGGHGELLQTSRTSVDVPEAAYRLHGGEPYVRARVTGPEGKHAWTQAVRVKTSS